MGQAAKLQDATLDLLSLVKKSVQWLLVSACVYIMEPINQLSLHW